MFLTSVDDIENCLHGISNCKLENINEIKKTRQEKKGVASCSSNVITIYHRLLPLSLQFNIHLIASVAILGIACAIWLAYARVGFI
jgi:hypothetical protein